MPSLVKLLGIVRCYFLLVHAAVLQVQVHATPGYMQYDLKPQTSHAASESAGAVAISRIEV